MRSDRPHNNLTPTSSPNSTPHDQQTERLYASSVPYEAMPEARTPRLLRSRLHPHQAKALHWMLNAERELDVAQALAEQRQQQQAVAAAAAMDGGGGAGAAAEGAGAGKGKGKGKKAAAAAAVSSSTVFFYEQRVYPASGRTVYYKCVVVHFSWLGCWSTPFFTSTCPFFYRQQHRHRLGHR